MLACDLEANIDDVAIECESYGHAHQQPTSRLRVTATLAQHFVMPHYDWELQDRYCYAI